MQPCAALRWSTKDVAASQCFDYWRESICAAFDPMSPELAREGRRGFRGTITAWDIGEACLMEIQATSHRTSRSRQDIAHGSHDYVFLYRQHAAASFAFGRAAGFVTEPGMVVIGHADRAFETSPTSGHPFHHHVLKFPRRLLEPMLAHADGIVTTLVSADHGIGALMASYFDSFIAQAPALTAEESRTALQCLVSLAASAYGAVLPDHDPRDALRRARVDQACRIIDRCMDASVLSPAFVARQLGLSPRTLHRLFESTGVSISRHIQRRRLDLACHRLRSPSARHQTVLDIALDCGFASLATFYRAFGEAYGTSPGALRRSGGTPPDAEMAPGEKGTDADR